MSIITQCPECETLFRASPQQLRASQGWVRCGHCEQVFDAASHAVSQRPPPVIASAPADSPPPLRVESAAPEPQEPLVAQETQRIPETLFVDTVAQVAPTRAHWGSAAGIAGAALLALMLLGQWLWHEKDMLAARAPALRPAFATLCAWSACTIKPPQTPEFLHIEASAYDPVGDGLYRLSLTLRNSAAWELANPAIELTITDQSEQPLVRRVLLPAAIGSGLTPIPAYGSREFKVYLRSALPIAPGLSGYRLTAFYP
jgi:predicted Zn finger-like uncharacterized protein